MAMKSIFCLLLLIVTSLPLQAQPTRDRVLGDVELSEHPEAVSINIAFNFPVRYLNHFPAQQGRELRIKLAPIAIGTVDRDALMDRESYTPEMPNLAGLTEVRYEGRDLLGILSDPQFPG